MVWKMGTDRIRVVEGGTEKGVMKILGWQKQKKCIVVSTEQNMTIVDVQRLSVQDMVVGYND